jgi:hypothetical protein
MSAFPLSAITLGNNVQAFFVNSNVCARKRSIIHSNNQSTDTQRLTLDQSTGCAYLASKFKERRQVLLFRFLAAVPPVIGACFVRDLGIITKYTGITGFAIIFFYPVLLCYRSRCQFIEKGFDPTTFYTCILTSNGFMILLVVFGVFMMFLSLFS